MLPEVFENSQTLYIGIGVADKVHLSENRNLVQNSLRLIVRARHNISHSSQRCRLNFHLGWELMGRLLRTDARIKIGQILKTSLWLRRGTSLATTPESIT